MSAKDIYDKMKGEIKKIAESEVSEAFGEEGRQLLREIDEAKEKLKHLTNPQEMLNEWKKAILHEAEEAIIAYLEEETKQYEIPSIFQLVPLIVLDIKNTTVDVDAYLYVSRPDIDASELRHADRIEAISFAVLRAKFKQDVSQPYNLNQIEEAIKSARFQTLEDSIKAQLTEEFEKNQKDIIVKLIPNYFTKYFAVFERIQNATKVFTN
jgi:uncharacterized membrane protein YheB (UPF0754 family)